MSCILNVTIDQHIIKLKQEDIRLYKKDCKTLTNRDFLRNLRTYYNDFGTNLYKKPEETTSSHSKSRRYADIVIGQDI